MMNIAISGYGKMGKTIEKLALEKRYNILAILDNEKDWSVKHDSILKADVIIDFSLPMAVTNNIKKAFALNKPIVSGTTGWDNEKKTIVEQCTNQGKTLFFAPNFSIGVNIFFELNIKLADMLKAIPTYDVRIEEEHHTQKLDMPSGTALKLAKDLLPLMPAKTKWVNTNSKNKSDLSVISIRKDNITGNHRVIYTSDKDIISIEHHALKREAFAEGALMAAQWVRGKKGYFEMKDMLNF